MQYQVTERGIVIHDVEQFDPVHILSCGQIFRYAEDDGVFTVYTRDKRCRIVRDACAWIILTNDVPYFVEYFDLARDYNDVKRDVSVIPVMQDATRFGSGIRILKQDFFEMIISFIISANNHIPRIKSIIERICASLGTNMGDYYAFPTPAQLARGNAEFFRSIGAGYRAEYLENTAKRLASENFTSWLTLPTSELSKRLVSLMGVGQKVADCIMLFGAGRTDVFPVDTWIKKVYADYFDTETNPTLIRANLLKIFGDNAGFAQQYLFFMKRELEKKF